MRWDLQATKFFATNDMEEKCYMECKLLYPMKKLITKKYLREKLIVAT